MDRLSSSFVVVDSTTDHAPPPPALEHVKGTEGVGHAAVQTDPATFLATALGGDDRGSVWAAALVTITGVATMADLALVDEGMAGDAAVACGLPLVPTKKLKITLAKLRASLASTCGETKETKDAETKDDGGCGAGGSGKTFTLVGRTLTLDVNPSDTADNIKHNIDIVRLAAEAAASMAEQQHPPAPPIPLEECIAICIDRSGSMRSPIREMTAFGDNANKTLERRSRMDAVKQIFYAFRDRVESLNGAPVKGGASRTHQIGLVQFDDTTEEMLPLTGELDLFESIVDDMKERGRTAIYSAIAEGVRMLTPVFESSPHTDLRILVLTDGQSNAGIDPEQALRRVNDIGAVVDAIVVGDQPDSNLRKIVAATGGQCFHIETLSEGFEMMESEGVVSLKGEEEGRHITYISNDVVGGRRLSQR